MTQTLILEVVRRGLWTIIAVSAPPLILGLVVGLVMSIFQAVTSIQEQTLAFIPKILAVLLSLLLFGPFMLNELTGYFQYIMTNLGYFGLPRP
jgi:flagellar biosynthetic protein FliQ